MKIEQNKSQQRTEATLTNDEVTQHVERVKQGDETSVSVLMEFLFPFVAKILNARLRYRESKEDVSQEIFIRVFSKIEQYSGKVPFHHWVSRIAVNTCTTAYHRSKANRELRIADLSEDEARVVESIKSTATEPGPADQLAARELVEKLLESLNPDDRLVISLVYLNGYSHQQVSDVTGWSVSLAKVRAFRARQRLRRTLAKLTADPDPVLGFSKLLNGIVGETV
ncbi:RNA polymerase sigma factor [Verrucomicrobia bacterium]|jgi:RNA polymerase sigma-70 factor, ECF subfamily|nr:RNA polymerase sigma factor [Verrucomicrobiota bacterium]MDA7680200.1 RNA polymerase sigma factor [bacterium]MDA7867215.1 RNA polymerase sigma factor [Verrucomicrobiota bacterium]MDB4796724.1 RNA polymerase sigma factor [bacterium]